MTSFQCLRLMYRVHRCTQGRVRSAVLAVWDAVKPIQQEKQ
jgi:hypothetical protein